ncbi:MAG TPA: hypothetical protein VJZ00_04345 [Thermoanaerobaculia bacterium]|nr:hypothetical protein [Thermoanaerobaculia bacterium]
MRRLIFFLLVFLLSAAALPLFAASELVLVPLWYAGPGDAGSNWTTHLSVYNTGYYAEPNDRAILPCQWLADPCPRGFWTDKMIVYRAPQPYSGGFVMQVSDPDKLHFSLRIFEEAAQAEDLGLDLPVVRERELRRGPIQIMDIPIGDPQNFRYTLRMYGIGDATTCTMRVNGYVAMADGTPDLVVTREIQLIRVPQGLGHFYFEDNTIIRDLILATGGQGQLRVELEPVSSNMRWWAFASSTNNRTQDVTIVTPR